MLWLPAEYGINLLLALAAAIGFWGIGRICWRALFPELDEDGLAFAFEFGIGAWIVWTSVLLLGLVDGYQHWAAWLLLGLSAALGGVQLLQQRSRLRTAFRPLLECGSRYEQALLALCAAIVMLAIAGALTPPSAQDALVHHLAMPKTLIKAGRLVELPYNYFSYFPAGMEMLFLYGLLVRGPGMATLLHLGFGLATFMAILAGGRMLGMSSRARLIAATAFLSVPTIWMEMTWAYIDLALTFYVTLALLALLGFRRERKLSWICLAGFALGGALSLKYTALFFAVILPLLLLFVLREQKESGMGALVRGLGIPITVALFVSCPWFIRNLIYTGNPFFPFFLNIIPSHNPGWDADRAALALIVLNRYGGDKKALIDYLLVPLKLSFLARYGDDRYYQGIVGPFYFFSLPLLLMVRRVRVEARYLLGFAITFYLFWVVSAQEIRYLLPVLPALGLTIATTDDLFTAKVMDACSRWWSWLHNATLALVMLIFLVNTGVIVYYFNQFSYDKLFFGRITPTEYLRSKFDYYLFYEYINAYTPANSRIFLVNASNQPYYLERDYFSDSVFESYTLKRVVAAARTPSEIKTQFQAMGMTHLLYRPHILFGPNTTPFTLEENNRFIEFLREDCKLLLLDQNQTFALFAIEP